MKKFGHERIIVDSSADWGVSDPLAVPKTANLMLERGVSMESVHLTCYKNALDAYGQSGQFNESDWLDNVEFDQSQLYSGNSVLRGQEPKKSSESRIIE